MRSLRWKDEILLQPHFRPNARGNFCNCERGTQGLRMPQRSNLSYKCQSSWFDGPKVQGPDPESISVLKSETIEPANPCLCIKTEEAYSLAYKALQDYKKKNIACLDIKKSHLYPKRLLPFMVFNQLDKELFRSVLTGNVYLAWSSKLSPYRKAITFRQGQRRNPRIAIRLADRLQSTGSRVEIFATLVHQMIHAYFLQCCGYRSEDGQDSGYDLGHGFEFQGLLMSIEKFFPQDTSRYIRDLKVQLRPSGGPLEKPYHVKYYEGGSNCADAADRKSHIQRVDCRQWCLDAQAVANSLEPLQPDFYFIINGTSISPKSVPRSEYNSPLETYIEIHFESMAFPIHRNEISQHIEGLAKLPAFTKDRVLTLPPMTNSSDLIALCQFLRQDTDKQFLAWNSFPVIDPFGYVSATQMIDAISAYYLSLNISFLPFTIHSLSQLSNQPKVSCPVDILDAIYYPQPRINYPNPDLRKWTRSWLSTRIPENTGSHYPTNLEMLREHPRYKRQYEELRGKSTPLAEDIDVIQASIKGKAEPKSPKTASTAQRPLVMYYYPPGQDPRHQLYAPQPLQARPNGVQQLVQTEQAHPPAVVRFWGQPLNDTQAVGQAALPTVPYQHQYDPWGVQG